MPFTQSRYQVRFEWGAEGLALLAPADVIVVTDVLVGESREGARVADAAAAASDSLVVLGSLRNRFDVAHAVLAEQERRGARTSVAVIAAGERPVPGGPLRVAIEDQLGAGAIIDALAELGIDHISPEAAVAVAAFRGSRPTMRHLLTACGSGQELIARGRVDEVHAAAVVDAADRH